MTKTIKDEAELKNMLVSLMVQATKDDNSANQTFEEQATYIFNVKPGQQDPRFEMPPRLYINKYLLTARVKACGALTPISLDKYIEDFHFGGTHSSTIDTEKEVVTTHNSSTMMCRIFISLEILNTYQVAR
ncbi:hypothetical protein [Pseudomonas germanica]|uniref:Uncharacterized protein n=1 Tax=Pseudomonas germanica TaxID=2815720 RepID=A0ABX8YRQ7_9PSED|nr:hypothetical protein [Pseudomonas germanica]QYY82465.1 hypothetical protein J0G10_03145 [Pseudomonas germanica]